MREWENKKMKRILLLNYEFPPLGGGASPVSYEIADRLSKTNDFCIDVITMGYKNLPRYEEVNNNFKIHRVKCLRSKKELCHPWEQATYLFFAWQKCKKLLKLNHYDLCHCHFIIPTGILAAKIKEKYHLPYIITTHGSDVLGYNARFKWLYPFLIKTWKNILNNANEIISPSNFLKSEIMKVYSQFEENKIKVIPNGFDTNQFKPQEKKKYIFSSGRLLVNKGFQYLIKAVSKINIQYEVHIAGDGPMLNELKQLAEKSKTPVIFHGWLNNKSEKYKNLLEQASIFVLASEKENASISLLEAMSAGCVVITTNQSGCAETIGDTGILIKPKNEEDLRLSLLNIINDQNLQNNKQAETRKRILNTYNWETVLLKYKQAYERNITPS